jgi:hypothetical protein
VFFIVILSNKLDLNQETRFTIRCLAVLVIEVNLTQILDHALKWFVLVLR